ncbi:SMEK domain-containing protein [Massilia aurea]|uniref:SMEK domain-containing protein n=1 Tax=Massilia aurea TaxID=373040 RepID=UPI0021617BED|nr:SMEK domain-containing protein [Massilia aurea]MCS0709933.1 SMEK domain-containing protein [Massilia aurea]
MFATAEAFQDVVVRLSVLRYVITSNTERGKNDIATDAENFFAGLLNLLCGWELVNLNVTEYQNYPAIDLGDKKHMVAIQVTAENKVEKIKDTIQAFYEHGLRPSYRRLIVLILSSKRAYTTDFESLKRDLDHLDIWDIDDVFKLIERNLVQDDLDHRDYKLIETLEAFTRTQLPSIVRSLSAGFGTTRGGLLGELEVVIGHPPRPCRRFIDALHVADAGEEAVALQAINDLYVQLKDFSYIGTRQVLAHAIQYSIGSDEFKQRFPYYYDHYISDHMLIFAPHVASHHMGYLRSEVFKEQVGGLQFRDWAMPLENSSFMSIRLPLRTLDVNLFYELKVFLANDIEKLRSLLVDLDFRHLD